MPTVIHMQSTEKPQDGPGVPLHRYSKHNWHSGGGNQFTTTTDPKKVTCKMCLRMLSK